jgi:hypothetical protein
LFSFFAGFKQDSPGFLGDPQGCPRHLLANIYAESQDWKGLSKVQGMMKAKGVKKVLGWSAIEVDG